GAWVTEVLLLSILAAATLAWNPVRAVVGARRRPRTLVVAEMPEGGAPTVDATDAADLALALSPAPHEMPAIDEAVVGEILTADAPDASPPTRVRARAKKKATKAEQTADHDASIAAAIDATGAAEGSGDELPSADLLTPAPPHNEDAGRRELDA